MNGKIIFAKDNKVTEMTLEEGFQKGYIRIEGNSIASKNKHAHLIEYTGRSSGRQNRGIFEYDIIKGNFCNKDDTLDVVIKNNGLWWLKRSNRPLHEFHNIEIVINLYYNWDELANIIFEESVEEIMDKYYKINY